MPSPVPPLPVTPPDDRGRLVRPRSFAARRRPASAPVVRRLARRSAPAAHGTAGRPDAGPAPAADRVACVPDQPTPPALADAPVLAHVTRGGVVESVHRASVAVTASDGTVLHAWGSVDDPVFPRSSNKPLQSVAMVRAGLTLPPHHLALASASHSGEPFHL